MDGFSPDFFLYWNLILSHLCKRFYLLQKQGCAMRNNSNLDEKA